MVTQGAFRSAGCSRVAHRRTAAPRRSGRALAVSVQNQKVLIVNTKSGGHAFIGLYLARELMSKGHNVTILNAGDQSIEQKRGPFSQYAELWEDGASIYYGDPTNPEYYPPGEFDVVYDNNGKSLEECQALIDFYGRRCSHYVFVGSAGAYVANSVEPMHVEGDARKAKAGHVAVENYLRQVGAPYTVFHPLYIYGDHTAKDCEQYFLDRLVRNRPVCIPAPGVQLTSISHVEDVASMMAAVPGNRACIGQHYNVSGDRCISLDGIVKMLAAELGVEPNIVHYNEKDFDIPKGKGFPFRSVHFFASTDKAKRDLGWMPRHTFKQDVRELVARYLESGRQYKDMSFEIDDMIIGSLI